MVVDIAEEAQAKPVLRDCVKTLISQYEILNQVAAALHDRINTYYINQPDPKQQAIGRKLHDQLVFFLRLREEPPQPEGISMVMWGCVLAAHYDKYLSTIQEWIGAHQEDLHLSKRNDRHIPWFVIKDGHEVMEQRDLNAVLSGLRDSENLVMRFERYKDSAATAREMLDLYWEYYGLDSKEAARHMMQRLRGVSETLVLAVQQADAEARTQRDEFLAMLREYVDAVAGSPNVHQALIAYNDLYQKVHASEESLLPQRNTPETSAKWTLLSVLCQAPTPQSLTDAFTIATAVNNEPDTFQGRVEGIRTQLMGHVHRLRDSVQGRRLLPEQWGIAASLPWLGRNGRTGANTSLRSIATTTLFARTTSGKNGIASR